MTISSLTEVRLWGRTIGAVSLDDDNDIAAFEYDSAFVRSGIEIAPLTMPLSNRVYTFPELPQKTFYGLPGLLEARIQGAGIPHRAGLLLDSVMNCLALSGKLGDRSSCFTL